ncbi:MAG TPA: imelysin family protein [Flavobacteriales bacterium]
MKHTSAFLLFGLALTAIACGCRKDDDDNPSTGGGGNPALEAAKHAAVVNYANIVHANYADAEAKAEELKAAIDAFVAAPSEPGLQACRAAWLEARVPYGQTEAFRFGNGPIDDEDGPEGLLNAWPMDEAYVDYVEGNATAGLINSTDPAYADITGGLLESLNEAGGETNISTGYHAIEFLLWGQDLSTSGPGAREWTDYTTAANAGRRGAFLKACAALLVQHLGELEHEWAEGVAGNHRSSFTGGSANSALSAILQGIGTLSKGELAGERMEVAMLTQDQEDEHSCFSDNTHLDIRMNALGIENVYLGRYVRTDGSTISGTSIKEVVTMVNGTTATEAETAITGAKVLAYAIPNPFDQQIQSGDPGGAVNDAVVALKAAGDRISAAASALGLTITTDVD